MATIDILEGKKQYDVRMLRELAEPVNEPLAWASETDNGISAIIVFRRGGQMSIYEERGIDMYLYLYDSSDICYHIIAYTDDKPNSYVIAKSHARDPNNVIEQNMSEALGGSLCRDVMDICLEYARVSVRARLSGRADE